MGELPWMPFPVADWMADPRVRRLGADDRASLVDLLCLTWSEGVLRTDVPEPLRRAYAMHGEWLLKQRQRVSRAVARRRQRGNGYARLLRDPKWQRRRTQILTRDDFTCTRCGAPASDVHHLRYLRGKPPWSSPDNHLTSLCRPCHRSEHRG